MLSQRSQGRKRLFAVVAAFVLVVSPIMVKPSPAAAASRQLCGTASAFHLGVIYPMARVCVNYIPSVSPTNYYLVESTRVWNPCSYFDYRKWAIMRFWANDGSYYARYTEGGFGCGQTVTANWPYPRVRNADFIYFTVTDSEGNSDCVRIRPPAWNATQRVEFC